MFVMNYEQNINNVFKNAAAIVLHKNGQKTTFKTGSEEFNRMLANLLTAFDNSRIMPAFGVSLHNKTIKMLESDCWLEIEFDGLMFVNELPFNKLLFKLGKVYGVDLIRQNDNKYDGRCIHIDFGAEKNLQELIFN